MQWRVISTNQIEVVFFLGKIGDKIIGLGGSPIHLLGRAQSSRIESSLAATQAALNYFLREEKALRQSREAIKPQDSEPEEAQMIKDWKILLMRTSESFVFRSELLSEKLEFVAKTLVTQEGVLLGTPLYAALP